jgi:hypothetical protein
MARKNCTPEQASGMLLEAEVQMIQGGHFAAHSITSGAATGFLVEAVRRGTSITTGRVCLNDKGEGQIDGSDLI